jgi:hypothetical protein
MCCLDQVYVCELPVYMYHVDQWFDPCHKLYNVTSLWSFYLFNHVLSCPFGNWIPPYFVYVYRTCSWTCGQIASIAICRRKWLQGHICGTFLVTSGMFLISQFIPLSIIGQIDWHATGFNTPGLQVKLATSACQCVRHRVQILCQHPCKTAMQAMQKPG